MIKLTTTAALIAGVMLAATASIAQEPTKKSTKQNEAPAIQSSDPSVTASCLKETDAKKRAACEQMHKKGGDGK